MKHLRIIGPSGAIDEKYIEAAKSRLEQMGFAVSEGRHVRGRCGRFAATDEERLADIREAMADETVDGVLCSRGGYGLQRIIDKVGEITKPVIGFSDITALHMLAAKQGVKTLHSIMCKHIATLPEDDETLRRTIDALEGKRLEYIKPTTPLDREGCTTARVIGGNLSVLYGLQGTPYGLGAVPDKWEEKPILLIEDIAERHYHIDRMMNNLRLSGVLGRISGLIVGQFSECEDDESMGETIYETIARYAAEYEYPVVFDFPVGHVERNLPIWLNTEAKLSVSAEQVRFEQVL